MSQTEASRQLILEPRRSVAEALDCAPARSGYYAIFVNDTGDLPSPYGDLLIERDTALIYIGIATVSLLERLVEQDLRHRHPSTFFRGIGPILGFRPPPGSLAGKRYQKNYRFSISDTTAIINWIDAHLSVTWTEADPALVTMEASLIRLHRPILNTSHNPDRVAHLAALRAECRRIAALQVRGKPD